MSHVIQITTDTSSANVALDQVEERAKETDMKVNMSLTNFRKSAAIISLGLQAIGNAQAQVFALLAESLLTAAESFALLASTSVITPLGFLQATAGIFAATQLASQAILIRQEASQAQIRSASAVASIGRGLMWR